jgi:hypothetical protein
MPHSRGSNRNEERLAHAAQSRVQQKRGATCPCRTVAGPTETLPIDRRCAPVVGDLRQRLGSVKRRADRRRSLVGSARPAVQWGCR